MYALLSARKDAQRSEGGRRAGGQPAGVAAERGPARGVAVEPRGVGGPAWDFGGVSVGRDGARRGGAGWLPVQTKLTVGGSDDPLEHEADRAADRVMRMADPAAGAQAGAGLGVQAGGVGPVRRACGCAGGCAECREEDQKLQRKAERTDAVRGMEAPETVHRVIGAAGRPMDGSSRSFFESRFGYDFGSVRVHTGAEAARSAREIGARAYTVGSNIVVGAGQPGISSAAGRRLIAHELAHVVQQGGAVRRSPLAREPEGAGAQRARGTGETLQRTGLSVQRQSAGCLELLREPGSSNIAMGKAVEAAIKADFTSRVGPPVRFAMTDASAAPYRTEYLKGKGKRPGIMPQVISFFSQGNPDLAFKSRSGEVMLLAEIKPGNWAGLAFAEEQLGNYIVKGNENEELKQELGVKVFSPMISATYTPPPVVNVLGKQVRTMWCGPGVIVYKAVETDEEKKKRKKKEEDEEEKKKKKQEKEDEKQKKKEQKEEEKKRKQDGKEEQKKKRTEKEEEKKRKQAEKDEEKKRKKTEKDEEKKRKQKEKEEKEEEKKKKRKEEEEEEKKKPKGKGGNVGFGIGILSSGGGSQNATLGVAIMSHGVTYGTASAGVVYDANGDAVGAASAGAGAHVSGHVAGAVAVGTASNTQTESVLSATAGQGKDTNAIGAANASAGNAERTSTISAATATKGDSKDKDEMTAGKAGKAQDGPETTGDKSGGKPGEGSRGLEIPGKTQAETQKAIDQAKEIDALLQKASPAQKALLTYLAQTMPNQELEVPDPQWVKVALEAMAGLSEEDVAFLQTQKWAPGKVTAEQLKKQIQERLKNRNTPQADVTTTPPDPGKDKKPVKADPKAAQGDKPAHAAPPGSTADVKTPGKAEQTMGAAGRTPDDGRKAEKPESIGETEQRLLKRALAFNWAGLKAPGVIVFGKDGKVYGQTVSGALYYAETVKGKRIQLTADVSGILTQNGADDVFEITACSISVTTGKQEAPAGMWVGEKVALRR
jgi:hypothetical protein